LKQAQIKAVLSGNEYTPILPEFEIYRTCLSHDHEPTQVSMEVLSIKTVPKDAKLLSEFFTCLASTTTNQRNGMFVPKGATYLLGPQIYEQNNFFLTTVATIPVNLQYNAWFAVIDPNQTLWKQNRYLCMTTSCANLGSSKLNPWPKTSV